MRDGGKAPAPKEESLTAAVAAAERDLATADALRELRLRGVRALTEANRTAWTVDANAAIETARSEAEHACDLLEAKLAALQSAASYRRWIAQSTPSRSARCSRPTTLSKPVRPIRESIRSFGTPPPLPPEPAKMPVSFGGKPAAVTPSKQGWKVDSMRSQLR
jgi:hypothetical protein